MAAFVKTYTFVDDTTALAGEVNANFDEIAAFLNNDVAHVDGSKPFTGIPMLPATNPTQANHAARKGYVDEATTDIQTLADQIVNDFDVSRAVFGSTALVGTPPAAGEDQVYLKGGVNLISVDGAGDGSINFGTPFGNGVCGITACVTTDSTVGNGTINHQTAVVIVRAPTLGGFSARIFDPETGNAYTSGTIAVTWIAVGW